MRKKSVCIHSDFCVCNHHWSLFIFGWQEFDMLGIVFGAKKGMVDKDWFTSFLRRRPEFSLRNPEDLSLVRAEGFTKETVAGLLKTVLIIKRQKRKEDLSNV
ncbi:hypothetical protein FQR65_LT06452 [Abscondita terminalis]|nr:hypothetical protein FQR65_LT06452 [Abscondita terminalis]